MSDTVVILSIIGIYLLFVLYLGLRAGKGQASTPEEYVVADRSLNLVVMFFLFGGSVLSAFAFLGGPGYAYSKGAGALFIMGYTAIGIIPWWILGVRARRVGQKFGYLTQGHLLKDRFSSKTLSVLIAIVTILSFIQYVSVQMKGSAYVFEIASSGAIPFWAGALISYVIILIYVFFGGVRGVAWTNVFQGSFMLIMAWILGIYVVYTLYDGPTSMFEAINQANPKHLVLGDSNMNFATFSSSIIVSGLGFLMWPHLFMKAYSAKSEKTLKQTIILYPTVVLCLIPIFFIGFAGFLIAYPDEVGSAGRILPWLLANKLEVSAVFVGITLSAVLAAAMSTQDSVTHAAGSVFYQDLLISLGFKNTSQKEATNIIRIFVVLFGIACYLVTVFGGQSLVGLLLGAYGSIVQIFPAIFCAFFWRRATDKGVIVGLLAGVIFNYLVVLKVLDKQDFYDLHAGVLGLIVNIFFVVVVSLLTRQDDNKAKADEFIAVANNDKI